MQRTMIAILFVLMYAVAIAAPDNAAAVKPLLNRPADIQTAAHSKKEHLAAAEGTKKTVVFLKHMAKYHQYMAAENKKLGHNEVAKHHLAISKSMLTGAKEYEALGKIHLKHVKTEK